jgi:uncharacterized protein
MQKNWTHWFEIPVSNFERAKKFYENIFDTQIDDVEFGPIRMGIFPHKETGCALCYNEEFYQPGANGPIVYMDANPDLQTALDKIETVGGKILVPKKQISPEYGYMAVFIDSEGNRMALHSSN